MLIANVSANIITKYYYYFFFFDDTTKYIMIYNININKTKCTLVVYTYQLNPVFELAGFNRKCDKK